MKTYSILIALALACASPTQNVPGKVYGTTPEDSKADAWNAANDPSRFDGEFNLHLADLPKSGRATRDIWPSTYWPTYEDSVNVRWNSDPELTWQGRLSPAEKYDLAFNNWTPPANFSTLRPFNRNEWEPSNWDVDYYASLGPLARYVSTNMGNRADREAALAAAPGTPPSEWPVEGWWGLCHAWTPAALLEDRPLRPVEHNGVIFEVADMEALLIAAYNRAPSAGFIGERCGMMGGDIARDEHGRVVDDGCRDTNAGTLHVIATNYLGLQNRGFAFDRTYDYEVWNQPVVGYEVTKQDEIPVERANELLGLTGTTYTFNPEAVHFYDVNLTVNWITESHPATEPNESSKYTRSSRYTYILEVDADGKILGGEYYGRSRDSSPDFLWASRPITQSAVPSLSIEEVRMLIAKSRGTNVEGMRYEAAGDEDISIPDGQPNGVVSPATISGAQGAVAGVLVDLNVTHAWPGDLVFTLRHAGVSRTFRNQEGGNIANIAVTDVLVSGFEGLDPNGEWELHVADLNAQDEGVLDSWTLTVITDVAAPPEPPPQTHEQRFAGSGNQDIPDYLAEGILQSVDVPEAVAPGTVSIEVDITHQYQGDLYVAVSFGDKEWILHNYEGGFAHDLRKRFRLDATGSAFTGDPSGTWTIRVTDGSQNDVGRLNSWAVIVEN